MTYFEETKHASYNQKTFVDSFVVTSLNRHVSGFVWRLSWGLFFLGEYFFRRVACYCGKKVSPRKKCHLGGSHTNSHCVSPLLYRLSIDPPNATTGHNLLAHVITFRFSHWGTLSELYSRCSNCIGAHISGWKAMRHS
jgi:hypothetical protein